MQVTINETNYESDDFNEEQKFIFNKIMLNTNAVNLTEHQLECLRFVSSTLVKQLETLLETKEDNATSEEA
jgi:hypothetical protein